MQTKLALVFGQALGWVAAAQEASTPLNESDQVAKKIQNPMANLLSVPVQNNWDFGIGSANAMRYAVNFQPIVLFCLPEDWRNL